MNLKKNLVVIGIIFLLFFPANIDAKQKSHLIKNSMFEKQMQKTNASLHQLGTHIMRKSRKSFIKVLPSFNKIKDNIELIGSINNSTMDQENKTNLISREIDEMNRQLFKIAKNIKLTKSIKLEIKKTNFQLGKLKKIAKINDNSLKKQKFYQENQKFSQSNGLNSKYNNLRFVQVANEGANGNSANTDDTAKKDEKEKKGNNGKKKFMNLDWGIGLTLTHDLGKRDRIEEASIVNNLVRVSKDSNDIPRIMLELHYLARPEAQFLGMVEQDNWGIGPFIGVQNGSEEIIQAVGAGLMVGFKYSKESNNSFNLGIGAIVDPHTKVLGDGIEKDKSLPTGETEIRFKETDQWGLFFVFSASF